MILDKRWFSALGLSLVMAGMVQAADTNNETVQAKVEKTLGVPVSEIQALGDTQLYQVTSQAGIFYVDAEVKYLVQGDVIDLEKRVNLTETAMSQLRLDSVQQFANDTIDYTAKDEKYVVTVFTDTDCGYCRKLHTEINEYQEKNPQTGKAETKPGYNDLGITIRYLAYPRAGANSMTYKTMQSVWCAEDKAAALSLAKNGKPVDTKVCDNTIMQQYAVGQQLGLRGTPAMVLPNGTMLPGYRNPADLLKTLEAL